MLKALITIQGVFSELDKDLTVRRLRKARELIREKTGKCEGKKPFGYREHEKPVIKYIIKLFRKPRNGKRLSYYKIAKRLNREKVPSRTGKPWSDTVIKQILRRETGIKA